MGPRRSVLLLSALLCLLVLCCAAPALALEPAGDGWYWQSPQPQGNALNAVAFGDATNVWAVGDGGTIMHSADAGVTWHTQVSPTTAPLGAVHFISATEGWAAGGAGWYASEPKQSSDGVILHTTDGGATWAIQASGKDAAVADIAFVGAKQGWAVGGRGLILHTTDGGQTWAVQASGVKRNLKAVVFLDARHGFAGGPEDMLLITADGGATWTRRNTYGLDFGGIDSLAVAADGKLWAGIGGRDMFGYFPRLAWSADAGRLWHCADVSPTRSVWDVVAAGTRLYAVGPSDDPIVASDVTQVLASDDDGATWRASFTGSANLGAIAANGAGQLCAVGDIAATSTDGGATWYGHSTRASQVAGIDMVGPTEAWAVDGWRAGLIESILFKFYGLASPSILHTTDGVRWQQAFSADGEYYNTVDFADASHGWTVGWDGLVRHTTDGGQTWQLQASGTKASLSTVIAASPQAAWAFGYDLSRNALAPAVVRTVDAGSTWTTVKLPRHFYPFAEDAATADTAWLAGIRSVSKSVSMVVLRTTDGGATWSSVALPLPSTVSGLPFSLDFVDADHGWVEALDLNDGSSTVLATSDGGATWSVVATQAAFGDDLIGDLSFVDTQEGWASGTAIYHTTDAGQTWTRQVAGSDAVHTVAAWDATHALAAGNGVLTTTDSLADSAAPLTLCDALGGWTRTGVTPTLTASDIGSSGLASTEYRVNGGAWTQGAPQPFSAPADHSGDGTWVLEYRSTDNAGNVEPTEQFVTRIDTIKPVVRLGRAVVGRDGTLRMRLRIDDKSCPSVYQFGFGIRKLNGKVVGGSSWDGYRLRTNKWITFRERWFGSYMKTPGTYRIAFRTVDRAGNRVARLAHGVLIVMPHDTHWPPRPGVQAIRRGDRVVYESDAELGAGAGGAPATVVHHRAAARSAAERLTAELRGLLRRMIATR